jgi:5-methyltetrahydropteroyltriglutamate--homocysteine methyltransferase
MPETAPAQLSALRPPFRADHVGSLLRPPELLKAREDAATGKIGADDLRAAENAAIATAVRRLSPQCGFSSTKEGNDLTEEHQWAKLALVVETALEVWGSL